MRLRILVAACLFVAAHFAAQAREYKYQTVSGDIMGTRIYTLDNGLKVYLSVNREKPRIQTYIAVRTGSRNDPPETTGLAHYLEHLMFKGTRKFGTSDAVREAPLLDSIQSRFEQYRRITDPQRRKAFYHEIDSISQLAAAYNIPNEYDKLMAAIGSEGSNAYTSNDVTCYIENIPSNEVENWAKVQADRFRNMVIRGFHTELEAVYEEFNIGLSNDGNKMWTAIFAKLYPDHPYGTQTTIGTQEHLKNPSIVNIKNYFNKYYVPNNVAVCMSGDMDPDKVIAVIDRYFGSWKANPELSYPEYAPVRELVSPVDTTVVGQEAGSLMVGWKFDGAASFQADTLDVISEMLSNGTAGLLDLDINQNMLCLGAAAGVIGFRDYSAFILQGKPKEGQTLDEVRTLMLGEIDKLKKGDFDDGLLLSVVNNMKLSYYKSLESNEERADMYVDAFVNGKEWSDVVGRLGRVSGITKAQIVDFANRHFLSNYAVVYKEQGVDTTQKKIDKPQITAIPSNRDKQSQFVTEVVNADTEPIQPRFLDFSRDLARGKTSDGLPLLYIKNNDNGLFVLGYYYKFGSESDKWLPVAADYLDYLGTDTHTAEQLKQKFYKLACSFGIEVGADEIGIKLSGLAENMPQAVALMEDFLSGAKADEEAYRMYVDLEEKSRKDIKLSQRANFNALVSYGIYGAYNPWRNVPGIEELRAKNPQELVDMIKRLGSYEHTVLYYGPETLADIAKVLAGHHRMAGKALPVPSGKEYMESPTPVNEILLAPYDAKNIYMRQYNNSSREWTPAAQPLVELFNEYYGGGMNSVVFQELRESRGLAYSASAYYSTPRRQGHPEYATTYIISQNDKMMDCIRTFNTILDTIPQSEDAFRLAKQSLMKKLAAMRVTKDDIFNSYFRAQRLGLDYDINEKVYNALPGITLDDMVRFEKETMAGKSYRYMILGDEKNLDIKALKRIAPVRRLATDEIFGY